jgi:hypothetical protein
MSGVKGMKFKTKRKSPIKIFDNRLCMYGCQQPALYEFGNGKVSCKPHGGNCPAKRQQAIEKFVEHVSQLDPVTGIKKSVTMALNAADTLRNQIDSATGVSRGISVRRTITENSIASGNRQAANAKEVMRKHNTFDTKSGLSLHQTNALKGRDTRLNDIDEQGCNSYDRMWANSSKCHTHAATGLYYQSRNEKSFLESLNHDQAQQILRGPPIQYIDPYDSVARVYLPDFIIGNTIYEIKSWYSWHEWKGVPQRDKNIAKLDATVESGYNVKLVIDYIEVDWPNTDY